MKHSGPDIFF